jgi:hypothetical protein
MVDLLVNCTCPMKKEGNNKGPKAFAVKMSNFDIHFWPRGTLVKLLKCGIGGNLIWRL